MLASYKTEQHCFPKVGLQVPFIFTWNILIKATWLDKEKLFQETELPRINTVKNRIMYTTLP